MTRTRQLDKPGLCSPSQAVTPAGFADFALVVAVLAAAVLAVVFAY